MGYVSLTCEFIEDGEKQRLYVGRPTVEGEDYIATQTAVIREEYPTATNIVVTENPRNDGYPYAVDALIEFMLFKRPDLDREKLLESEWLILTTDRKEYQRGAYVCNLSEAKAIFDDEDSEYTDWVYLREFGIVVFDVTKHTSHEIFLAHWYTIIKYILNGTADFERKMLRYDWKSGDAEKFLHAKYGFYMTSAYGVGSVNKSADMKLTFDEKQVFSRFRFRDLEPD